MRFFFGFLLVLFAGTATAGRASRYFDYFNTDTYWNRLSLDTAAGYPELSDADTCIVVASNRALGADSLRFMSEIRDDGRLRYFLVYSAGGKWHLRRCPGLTAGLLFLEQRNGRPLLVYTEGMGKIFTSDLDRGMRMAGQYGVNVLLLDYPSIHSHWNSYKNYRFAWNNSTRIYKDFLPVFDTLKKRHHPQPVSLFFHSMGNNLIRKLVQKDLLDSGGKPGQWADNVILNAPCVPRRGSRRWIDKMHFSERIYVHFNPEDRTLKLAGIVGLRGILGLGPKRKVSKNAVYIDFNDIAGYSHSNFMGLYGRPDPPEASMAHYRRVLRGAAAPVSDTGRYVSVQHRPGVYRLR